jgi:hypothetical protein
VLYIKEEEVEDSARDFDFEEEGGEVSTPQRRTPGGAQRVLNDLQRNTLSCDRMIWLLARPPLPPREQGVSLSLSSCVSPVELTDGRGGRVGVGLGISDKKIIPRKTE